MRNFLLGLKALFSKTQRSVELDEELQGYLAALAADKMQKGASRTEALRKARMELGSFEAVKEDVRSVGWDSVVDSVWHDLRFSIRTLAKSPGFTAVAILSLALGIGANTAIFTLVNDLMLRSLAVRAPHELVAFGTEVDDGEIGGITPGPLDLFPYDFYLRVKGADALLKGLTAYSSFTNTVSYRSPGGQAAAQAISHIVSGNFFDVLGATAFLGRAIRATDDVRGREPVAVLSYPFWASKLGADRAVIGKTIQINGTASTIIGVMPANFSGVSGSDTVPDFWTPLAMQPEVMMQPTLLESRGLYWLRFMGRRQRNVSDGRIQSWINGQLHQYLLEREGPVVTPSRRHEIAGIYVQILPGARGISNLRASYGEPLKVLMGAVVVVLLIACANLANFLLARASSREREISTRLALGSGRARIVRQLMIDALVLAISGGALGMAVSYCATRVLIRFVASGPGYSPLSATPDAHVLLFTLGVSLIAGLLFGLAPALRVPKLSAMPGAQAGVRSTAAAGASGGRIVPQILLTAQVVLSLILLATAGLFVRTLHNLRDRDFGFNRRNVLVMQFNAKFAGYKSDKTGALYRQITDRIAAVPGIRSVAVSGAPPMSRASWNSPIYFQGNVKPVADTSTLLDRVGPHYFETLGIGLLKGRPIGNEDAANSLKVAVLNQAAADHFFPAGDAIGHTFKVADPSVEGEFQIVGVVSNSKYNTPREEPQRMTFLPVVQLTGDDSFAYILDIQTSGKPLAVVNDVRKALASVDPNIPILNVKTITEITDTPMANEILISRLAGFFSGLALLLACIGLYGVMTYNVLRRSGEIGIRMTLGARPGTVLSMILKESAYLLLAGTALGVPATLAVTRLFRSQLFGLSSSDPLTLAGSALIVGIVVLISGFFPARRATRLDPMITLRYQ